MSRPCIMDIPLGELPIEIERMGLKRYAADQLVTWLYGRGAGSFGEMTDIAKTARESLSRRFDVRCVSVCAEQSAADGTRKLKLRLHDGECVEAVIIPAEGGRTTLCVSTQVGCAMGCAFCRTASMGLKRNCTQGEILGQVIEAKLRSSSPITNVVFMGMGEPLMNMEAVCDAIDVLMAERALCLSKRRITVSTAGLIPELEAFVGRSDVKIAISLNATSDEQRSRLMPINRRYPLASLMAFCRDYSRRSRYRVTFEYVLIGGINDTDGDRERLVRLLDGIRAKINLIPLNPVPSCGFKPPAEGTAAAWRDYLVKHGIQANVRASRGGDIRAACGQLASNIQGE